MATDIDNALVNGDAIPSEPIAHPLGFGQINVGVGDRVEQTENMPFDGYIAGVDVIGWPSGANNAIGFNIRVEGGNPIVPFNYSKRSNEFVSADDAVTDITIIEPGIERGDEIEVVIENGSTSNQLDLNPLVVTVTNFNPLLLPGAE